MDTEGRKIERTSDVLLAFKYLPPHHVASQAYRVEDEESNSRAWLCIVGIAKAWAMAPETDTA